VGEQRRIGGEKRRGKEEGRRGLGPTLAAKSPGDTIHSLSSGKAEEPGSLSPLDPETLSFVRVNCLERLLMACMSVPHLWVGYPLTTTCKAGPRVSPASLQSLASPSAEGKLEDESKSFKARGQILTRVLGLSGERHNLSKPHYCLDKPGSHVLFGRVHEGEMQMVSVEDQDRSVFRGDRV
jgi:hypothetical protein